MHNRSIYIKSLNQRHHFLFILSFVAYISIIKRAVAFDVSCKVQTSSFLKMLINNLKNGLKETMKLIIFPLVSPSSSVQMSKPTSYDEKCS